MAITPNIPMRGNAPSRWFVLAAIVTSVVTSIGCARPPQTAYTFDPAPGAWDFDGASSRSGLRSERYTHAVHSERLEVFEVARPAPGTTAAEFTALAPAARALPTLGETTTTMRALADDELGGTGGFWVAQYGRDGSESLQAAAFVVPGGRRHFVVRLASSEDDVDQMQGWLRDTLLRNFHFPPPAR